MTLAAQVVGFDYTGDGGAFVFDSAALAEGRAVAASRLSCTPAALAHRHLVQEHSRVLDVLAVEREALGLVRVPTSGLGYFEERKEQQKALGVFEIDAQAKRLTSLRAAVGFAARAMEVQEAGHRDKSAWMVTLTYRDGVAWHARHVSEAIRCFRRWCQKRGFPVRYVWIGELQDGKRRVDGVGRQVIHYHLVVWLPPKVRAPHFDRKGWWPHGMSNVPPKPARSGAGYLISYCKKTKDLSGLPRGARAYGVGGLDHAMRRARRWLRLPSMVQGNGSIWDGFRPVVGGGWSSPHGVHMASEFQRIHVGGVWCLTRVARHERAIEAAGPFSWLTDRTVAVAVCR